MFQLANQHVSAMHKSLAHILLVTCMLPLGSVTQLAYATNGMALSGYGPVAMSMGGASTAYDNGNYGAINNPATLALMDTGSRVEAGMNIMHIDAQTWAPGMPRVDSEAEWFVMPTISYITHNGQWSYGIGMFSQGGLGADYGSSSFLSTDPVSGIPTGLPDESEALVGRLIFPLAYAVSDNLTIGGSLDLVYARLTLKQLMPRAVLEDMLTPGRQTLGSARVDPVTADQLANINYAHFDLDKLDNSGLGGQIGFTYRATDRLTIGASYQFETRMGDLEGNSNLNVGIGANYTTVPGKGQIEDAQWPSTFKIGLAYQATDELKLVTDIKQYQWSDVLDTFKIRFRPDSGGFVDVDMTQKWDDLTVYSVGGEYILDSDIKLRAGFNYGKNPVPSRYLQHLGEAITEKHLMLGVGFKAGKNGQLDLAYTHTFENEDTNTNPLVGLTSSMSQDSFNINYSYRF